MGGADRELAQGDEFAGFVIEFVLGRGGMGVVYRARQQRPTRLVAIKVLASKHAEDELYRERFRREGEAMAQVDHPNVVPVYATGEVDGLLYIATRFIEGENLAELCEKSGRIDPPRAARLVTQIAAALDAAHHRGVVHRDVKPENVLVAIDPREEIDKREPEHLYLTDFGIAKRATETRALTVVEEFIGTIDYMAPEQANGERVDARTDVYALGCVLYKLLVGAVPLPRDDDRTAFFAHASGAQPVPPSKCEAEVPVAFDAIIARAMARDPDDRFVSAGDLARAATAAALGKPQPPGETSVAVGEAKDGVPPIAPALALQHPDAGRQRRRAMDASTPTRPPDSPEPVASASRPSRRRAFTPMFVASPKPDRPPRRRWPLLLLAAGLVAAAAVALVALVAAPSDDRPIVKIGTIHALSGNDPSGPDALNGVRLAIRYVNDGAGLPDLGLPFKPGAGLPRLGGARIVPLDADSQGNRCRAEPLFRGLVKRGAVAVVGSEQSSVTLQAIRAADDLKIPLVNDAATAPSLTSARYPDDNGQNPCHKQEGDVTPSLWFFRVGPDDVEAADVFKAFLQDERRQGNRVATAAILYEAADVYGGSVAGKTTRVLDELGVHWMTYHYPTVLGQPAVKRGSPCTPDEQRLNRVLRGTISKIKSSFDPDVLFTVSYLPDAVATVQIMSELHYTPPAFLAYGAGYDRPEFDDLVAAGRSQCRLHGADPRGIITRVSWSASLQGQTESAVKVAEAFHREFGTEMTSTSARAFTATLALAQAINAAGSRDPALIKGALERLAVPGQQTIMPWTGIRFGKDGQNTLARNLLEQRRSKGRRVVVFPPQFATRSAIWPLKDARR